MEQGSRSQALLIWEPIQGLQAKTAVVKGTGTRQPSYKACEPVSQDKAFNTRQLKPGL
jgi:hypothetical protein